MGGDPSAHTKTMNKNQPRKPSGTPIGGQFDTTPHHGPAVTLTDQDTNLDSLIATVRAAATAYYNGTGDSPLTDAEYDAIIDQVTAAADRDPNLANRPDVRALLGSVSAGTGTGTVTHERPMLSMDKVRTPDDVKRFLTKLDGKHVIEPKIDGTAISARYQDGRLTSVITRGDGRTGQDVTARCQNIAGLPTTLPGGHTGEVRGEVFMTRDDFDYSQQNRTNAGEPPFSNPRNAAAGLVTRPEAPNYDTALTFAGYDFDLDGHQDDSYDDRAARAATLGFITARDLVPTGDDLDTDLDTIEKARKTGDIPIDGAVIKADSMDERDRLGAGSRAPKWAVAYKYEAEKATTRLIGIERAIGRTGNVSYTAILEGVEVDGSVVSKATLHNGAFIEENDLRIGDTVVVYKAGDIIPRVAESLPALRPEGTEPYTPPSGCPTCGEPLDKSGAIWKCHTPSCSTTGGLAYAMSRDALDVDGFSDKIADAIADAGYANDFADLFTVDVDQLADLPLGVTEKGNTRRLGRATATKIVNGLNEARTQPLNRVITALGVRGTGRGVSRRLADHYGDLDALYAATADELAATPMGTTSSTGKPLTLGPAKGKLIADQLATDYYKDVLQKLKDAGVTTKQDPKPATPAATGGTGGTGARQAPLAGMNVVVTGSMKGSALDGKSRNEMNELIEQHGGRGAGSVSKTTHLLVCGEEGSSKWVKAKALGVRVVTPDEFAKMLSGDD